MIEPETCGFLSKQYNTKCLITSSNAGFVSGFLCCSCLFLARFTYLPTVVGDRDEAPAFVLVPLDMPFVASLQLLPVFCLEVYKADNTSGVTPVSESATFAKILPDFISDDVKLEGGETPLVGTRNFLASF